jgi:lysyl endopeptidase
MKVILTAILFFSFTIAMAQRSDNSMPHSFSMQGLESSKSALIIPRPEAEIQVIRQAESFDKVYDFGVAIPVNDDILSKGEFIGLPDGKRLVRRIINAKEAYGINLNFSKFNPGQSGKLWIYSEDKMQVIGGFDYKSAIPGIPFATAPVKGESVILEFVYDASEAGIEVEIGEMIYEFSDIFEISRAFGGSGSCNKNVNCIEYSGQQNQKRSVAMILTQNNVRWCSGAMINNTAQDGKPYFLTARHCNTTANSIFMFNYESPDCSNIDGSTQQTIQGCTIRVNWQTSDVTLVELSSVPPGNYFAYFSGWNASAAPADSVFGIHHPKGDIKKISFERNQVFGAPYTMGDTALSHWKISNWEVGTTETGSSGSPLFNHDGEIVGQLHGGLANCANSVNDYYGRFNYSWEGENTPETALKFWLDPGNTGQMQLNGNDFNAPAFNYDLTLTGLAGPDSLYCLDQADWVATVRNNGMITAQNFRVRLFKDGTEIASREISQTLPYGNSFAVAFPSIPLGLGQFDFKATVEFISPLADENPLNDSASKSIERIFGDEATVNFRYDLFSTQTKWGIYRLDGSAIYQSTVAASYENILQSFCLPAGCYLFRVTDNGKDGICCQVGEGSFSVTGSNGGVLVQNEKFTELFEKKFCVPGLPADWEELFEIYPNPSNSQINVKVQSYAEGFDSELVIFSVDGKVLVNQKGTLKYLNTFDVSEWAQGIYFVRIRVGKLKSVQKFIKN